MMRAIWLAGAWLLSAGSVAAAPVTLYCTFTTVSTSDTQSFAPESFRVTPSRFGITFIVDGQRAYIVGNLGTANVDMHRMVNGGVIFTETTPSGTKQVTAIDPAGNAAHSRCTFFKNLAGDTVLVPAQHYGRCIRRD